MEPTRIKPASEPSGISEETWRGSGEPAALLLPANSLNQPLLSPTTYTPFSNFKGDETMPGSPIRSLYTHTHTHRYLYINMYIVERRGRVNFTSDRSRSSTHSRHEESRSGFRDKTRKFGFEFLWIGRKLVDDRLPVNNVTSFRASRYGWWNRVGKEEGEEGSLEFTRANNPK